MTVSTPSPGGPAPARPRTPARPLHRREPWLAVLLAALALALLAYVVPPRAQRPVLVVAGAVGAAGLVLLVRHRPDAAEEAEVRAFQRPQD